MRAFRVAYDGTGYRGFQRQPHGETVEDALLDALRGLGVLDADRETPPGYAAAGRTDAGVSAAAQTVAFEAPDWLSPAAIDGELPGDVWAWASADVPPTFHATRDTARRTYEYHLHAPPEAVDDARAGPVDNARAEAALSRLTGEHDFHNLTPADRGTTRDLRTDWRRDDQYLVLEFSAPGFPREFVRRAVSLVRSVATGERDPGFVDRVLAEEPLSGPEGVGPATPEPLVLSDVRYPDVTFVPDEAAASARAALAARRVDRQTGARVAGRLRSGIGE